MVFKIDFLNPEQIEKCIQNSAAVFSTIGTTKAKVGGDKEPTRKIDYEINLLITQQLFKIENWPISIGFFRGADSSSKISI